MARHFDKITIEELEDKISQARTDAKNSTWRELTNEIEKDLSKCHFDCENEDILGDRRIFGYHTLPNGFTFFGISCAGDWEVPVFWIIYQSKGKLRAYIPTDGNPWNTDTGMAYGNTAESNAIKAINEEEKLFDAINIRKRYPEYAIDKTDEEIEENFMGAMDDIKFEPDKILADIEARTKPK